MDEEEMLKRITRMLERGCTMLASHHDCGAPLFRCKGEIVCPVCTSDADRTAEAGVETVSQGLLARADGKSHDASSKGSIEHVSPPSIMQLDASYRDEQMEAIQALRQVLVRRLKGFTREVEAETDLDKMHRYLGCIERILSILNALDK